MHLIEDAAAVADLRGAGPLRRTRTIIAAASVAAVVVNAGAMWAYWDITGTGERSDVEMTVTAQSSRNVALHPGSTGDLIVTVTNDNAFPIHLTSVRPGPGNAIADDEHRERGCERTGVSFSRQFTAVDWRVARNNVAVFTVRGGLLMSNDAEVACRGAVFTVPVRVSGSGDA